MSNLVTIKTFTYSHEAAIIRSRLEVEGFYCFIQDEFTAQVYPFSSNATGGAKLQVRNEDAADAIALLKESGDLTDNDFEPSALQLKLYRILSKLPIIKRFLN